MAHRPDFHSPHDVYRIVETHDGDDDFVDDVGGAVRPAAGHGAVAAAGGAHSGKAAAGGGPPTRGPGNITTRRLERNQQRLVRRLQRAVARGAPKQRDIAAEVVMCVSHSIQYAQSGEAAEELHSSPNTDKEGAGGGGDRSGGRALSRARSGHGQGSSMDGDAASESHLRGNFPSGALSSGGVAGVSGPVPTPTTARVGRPDIWRQQGASLGTMATTFGCTGSGLRRLTSTRGASDGSTAGGVGGVSGGVSVVFLETGAVTSSHSKSDRGVAVGNDNNNNNNNNNNNENNNSRGAELTTTNAAGEFIANQNLFSAPPAAAPATAARRSSRSPRNSIDVSGSGRGGVLRMVEECGDKNCSREENTNSNNDENSRQQNRQQQQQQQQQQGELVFVSQSVFQQIPRLPGPVGRYEKLQVLGRGSFGETWLVQWVPDAQPDSAAQSAGTPAGGGAGSGDGGVNSHNGSGNSVTGSNNSNNNINNVQPGVMSKRAASFPQPNAQRGGDQGDGAIVPTSSIRNKELQHAIEDAARNNATALARSGGGGAPLSLGAQQGGNNDAAKSPSPLLQTHQRQHQRQHQQQNAGGGGGATTASSSLASAASPTTAPQQPHGISSSTGNSTAGGGATAKAGGGDHRQQQQQLQQPPPPRPPIVAPISTLACTKPFVRLSDGRSISAESVFVCKIETKMSTTRKSDITSGAGGELNEQKILSNCAHPGIVGFIEDFDDDKNFYLVMEYLDGGDLRQEIQRRLDAENIKYFSEPSLLFLFVQICLAVEYLHRHNILHRDLKTSNVLLSKKWNVKLADFGFAKSYSTDVDMAVSTSRLGTPYYMAPETWLGEPYSEKADMWSLGVLLYELTTLHRPFDGASMQALARSICEEPFAFIHRDGISDDLMDLVESLLQKDPKQRPTCKQVLQSPVMQQSMQEFLAKFSRAANASPSHLDRTWARVLKDHCSLLARDEFTSQVSRNEARRGRSSLVASSMGMFSQNPLSLADRSAGSGNRRSSGFLTAGGASASGDRSTGYQSDDSLDDGGGGGGGGGGGVGLSPSATTPRTGGGSVALQSTQSALDAQQGNVHVRK